jgi:hypothetical protein
MGIGARGDVEQALVGIGVQDNRLSFAFHRQHHWPLALLELPHKISGAAAEGSERMDVFGGI